MSVDIEASIGLTREWDAWDAGREVAMTAIEGLSRPPDIVLLLSSIHYEKYGGFHKFLEGVWDVLPKGTQLAGGTVAGFMNNLGCFSRGATALALSSPLVDAAIGIGKNAKRNPQRAARQSADMVSTKLKASSYENRFLLNFISGPVLPQMPGVGQKKYIRSGFVSRFALQGLSLSQTLVQKGLSREDEVFDETIRQLPEYQMILGTSVDDYRGLRNYQFINDQVMTNVVLDLGLATDLGLRVCTTHGMKATNLHFSVTKLGSRKHAILEINGKPAVPELLRILKWPEGFLNEETMLHTILYYPISLNRHGRSVPIVTPMIMKDYIFAPCIIDEGEVSIMTVSGRDLINAVRDNLKSAQGIDPEFGVFSTCMTILQTLGRRTTMIHRELKDYFKDKPFLLFYSAGEGTYTHNKEVTYANMSFNSAVFGHNKAT